METFSALLNCPKYEPFRCPRCKLNHTNENVEDEESLLQFCYLFEF